jgi:hypothetical protein
MELVPKHWGLRRSPTATREQLQSVEAFSHFVFSFSVTCFHLSRRTATCINTPLLRSKWKTLIIEIQNPLLSCVLANPWEKSLPLALVISFAGIQKRQLHPLPIGAPTPFEISSIDCKLCCWFLESVVGRVLDSGCRLKTVVGFEFYLPGCTSYRCLQQVILASLKLVIRWSSYVVKIGTPLGASFYLHEVIHVLTNCWDRLVSFPNFPMHFGSIT